jgi:anthranilate synthase component 1
MFTKAVTRKVPFTGDPLWVFERLTEGRHHTVLFESPIGAGRQAEKSLVFPKNALSATARNRTVTFEALTEGGRCVLEALVPELEAKAKKVDRVADRVEAAFSKRLETGSDRDRIKAPSAADALRILSSKWDLQRDTELPVHLPGVFSYDFLEQLEVLPEAKTDRLGFPDYVFWLPEQAVLINHREKTAQVSALFYAPSGEAERAAQAEVDRIVDEVLSKCDEPRQTPDPLPIRPQKSADVDDDVAVDLDDEAYAAVVRTMKEHIIAGDVFQIVPSRTFSTPCPDAKAAYKVLRKLNPSPYLFYVNGGDFEIFGASPEAFVRVFGTPKIVEIHPIAGTRPRGRLARGDIDHDLDNRLEADLRLDKKELAEHMMLVDLARNDVARISRPGTRRVKRLSEVERYSHVMHLVSVIEGELEEELDALHAYLASMNMGTLVGAPKIEAAKLLRKYEADKRGIYGGAVGFITSDGEMETAIVIRSALVKDGVARIRAGAGIVYDSDPMSEAVETSNKAGAVLKAIRLAKGGE